MTAQPPVDPDEILDRIVRIFGRHVAALEAKPELTPREVDLLVRVAGGVRQVLELLIDPLGPEGRRRLARMSDEELRAARERLEAAEKGTQRE